MRSPSRRGGFVTLYAMSPTTKLLIFLAALLLVSLVSFSALRRFKAAAHSRLSEIVPSETYLSLRNQVLQGLRGKVNLPPSSKPTEPYAVLMDWNTGTGIATVAAIVDGTASIYLSNGGGSLGGGQRYSAIHDAALKAVSIAGALQPQMTRIETFPLPLRGGVVFYVVTDAGVFSTEGDANELAAHRHPMSALGDAMQNIVTQYRALQADK